MNKYEIEIVNKEKNYTVAKSNALVLNSRYKYSVNQQRMIAYICSKIKPVTKDTKQLIDSPYQLEYEFEIADYIRVMGIKSTGDAYNEIKATLKSLRDKSYWLTLADGSETTVSWINKVRTNKRSGHAQYRLDEDLAPYLFELQEKYLSYGLINILNFTSKYSIRLYEIFKAHYDLKRSQQSYKRIESPIIEWQMSLDDFKHLLMLDTEEEKNKYKNFADFRKNVIEVARKEINELSDMKFDFEPLTKGRKTVAIVFSIQFKNAVERMNTRHYIDQI